MTAHKGSIYDNFRDLGVGDLLSDRRAVRKISSTTLEIYNGDPKFERNIIFIIQLLPSYLECSWLRLTGKLSEVSASDSADFCTTEVVRDSDYDSEAREIAGV